jgi:hypothetical protein
VQRSKLATTVTTLDDLEQQKRDLAAGQAALAIERATFDAERREFADQAATLAGRLSVEWDRMEKLRADQTEEPIEQPPGDPSDLSQLPGASLEFEGDSISGTSPGAPSVDPTKEDEGADLPAPPEFQPPVGAGLDVKEE